MATTGYQAGIEANQVQVSYAAETAYGVKPAVAFQAIRLTADTLSGKKTRAAPAELNTTGMVSAKVTEKVEATGDLSFALSFGTYDDMFASALNGVAQAPIALSGAAGDITLTTGTNVLSSSTANKFTNIQVGQWISIFGFTNAVNNGIFEVLVKQDNTHLILSGAYNAANAPVPFVTETPAGAAAQVRAQTLRNGTTVTTLFIQKQFSPTLFLQYPGSYVSALTLSGGVGSFLNGKFTIMASAEQSAVVNGSTGAVVAAPNGLVHNSVGGFGGVFLNQAPIQAVIDSFTLTITSTGAALEYGMGNPAAQGQIAGLIEVAGTLKCYFKDFTLYNRFVNETIGALAFMTADNLGNTYVITLPYSFIMNPTITAGGQNQPVWATFTIEGNPPGNGLGMIQIDALPAT